MRDLSDDDLTLLPISRRLYGGVADVRNDGVRFFSELTSTTVGVVARLDFSVAKTTSSFMDSAASADKSQNTKLNTENWKKWVLNGMLEGKRGHYVNSQTTGPLDNSSPRFL